jgi:pimeloyl-ACP methyl ester carboxylesterase
MGVPMTLRACLLLVFVLAAGLGPVAISQETPFMEEELGVPTEDGVVLGCTLTLPVGEGPFPGAVLLTVAGPNDRDQSVFFHKGFAVLGRGLAAAGVASLRCDDRGVGASTGEYFQATYDDLASGAIARFRALAARPEVDNARVGFVGNSEGGAIGPLAASRTSEAAFVVLLAGPGVPGAKTLRSQLDAAIVSLNIETERATELRDLFARFLEIQTSEPTDPATRTRMRVFLESGGKSLFPPYGFIPKELDGLTDYLLSPWHRSMVAHDPATVLRRLKIPVLALAGDKDRALDPTIHLEAIRLAIEDNPKATVEILPGLNHLFQTAVTGAVAEYGMLQEAISPTAVSRIGDWILALTAKTLLVDD